MLKLSTEENPLDMAHVIPRNDQRPYSGWQLQVALHGTIE
jgi:hypothetical protein